MTAVASTQDLAAYLAALSDREVVSLLRSRPDLVSPPPTSLTLLAVRAAARPSVEAVLEGLDAPTLAVAEALLALGEDRPGPRDLADALGVDHGQAAAAVAELGRLALVVGGLVVPGLAEALGPTPFGLGPSATVPPTTLPPPLEVLEEAAAAQDPPAAGQEPGEGHHVPAASLALLRALAWGPPSGTLRAGGQVPAAEPLLERGWLERSPGPDGGTRLVLPRQVALALRGGRLTRERLRAPDPEGLETVEAGTLASEAALGAEETVRRVRLLLDGLRQEPAAVLRAGGVGARVLGRVSQHLGVDRSQAAGLLELAAGADLLGLDETGTAWVPSAAASDWEADSLPGRWARLAAAWADCARTSWLVGTRDDSGVLRPALGPALEAGWAGRLRRRVLSVLAGLPQGAVAGTGTVGDVLAFQRPRATPPPEALDAVLTEMAALGLTGAGALSPAGRVLARFLEPARQTGGSGAASTDPDREAGEDADLLAALEAALDEALPAVVDTILIQSDLTAVVPGRPGTELASLLEMSSVVESRGGALTVRFTPESVRGALDTGVSSAELVEALGRFSPAPLPSALEALVRDVSRRHGAVRVRAVASVLRVEDPAVAAGLLADHRLEALGLDELAPGVLASPAPPDQLLRGLRATGLAPAVEDAGGRLLLGARRARPEGAPQPARPGSSHLGVVRRRAVDERDLVSLVRRMRVGEEQGRPWRGGASTGAASDRLADRLAQEPAHVLTVLRQAQPARTRLRVRLAGAQGAVQERQVQVVAVEPGRVRLRDLDRQTELTVAVHRIVSASRQAAQGRGEPLAGDGAGDGAGDQAGDRADDQEGRD